MANKNYEALIEIGGKVQPSLRQATNNACKCLDKINNTIQNTASNGVKAFAGLFALDKLKDFSLGMVDSAATMESYRNTLNIVMKDQKKAAKMMAWAVNFANKTPFDTQSIVEASVRLSAYGIDAQKSMTDIGNMASVMNKPIMQAVEAIADAQTGELERLKEFGITKTMIAQKANEMYRNQEIINKKGQITDQQKFNDALLAIMKDRYTNGMLEQAKTWNGVKSTIAGVWQTAIAQIAGISDEGTIKAGSFFDILTQKGYELSILLQKLASDGTFTRISYELGAMLQLFIQLCSFVKSAFIPTMVILAGVFGGLGVKNATIAIQMFRVQQALAAGQSGILAALMRGQLVTALRMAAIAGWQTAAAFLAVNWPFILIGAAIAAVIAIVIVLVRNWDTIKAKIIEVANTIWTYGTQAWNSLVTTLQNAWAKIQPLLNLIKDGIRAAFNFTPIGMAVKGIQNVSAKVQERRAKRNALGSASFSGGTTLVGEQGPELVNLPRGSRIFSNAKTNNILGNSGVNVNITINGNANPQEIQNAASAAFMDFQTKYNAMMSRNRRLGYT